MLNRINQVISALTAKITEQDETFVAKQLNAREQKLFWQMNLPDQRHALNVTYTALRLAQNKSGLNLAALTKGALLHDVGKVRGDVST
jgi:HD superfamily phosphodiesterase